MTLGAGSNEIVYCLSFCLNNFKFVKRKKYIYFFRVGHFAVRFVVPCTLLPLRPHHTLHPVRPCWRLLPSYALTVCRNNCTPFFNGTHVRYEKMRRKFQLETSFNGSVTWGAVHGGAVGWRTALQVGRSRVRHKKKFPMVSMEFFISGRTVALGSTQPLTEMSTRNISWGGGKGGRCLGLKSLPPLCVDCLEIWERQPPGTLWACAGTALPLPRGVFRPRQLPRAVDLKGRLLSCQSY